MGKWFPTEAKLSESYSAPVSNIVKLTGLLQWTLVMSVFWFVLVPYLGRVDISVPSGTVSHTGRIRTMSAPQGTLAG